MPYGNFYVGKEGFLYKKNNGGGTTRQFSLGAICNQPTDINNKYVSGSGVSGAVSSTNYAIRRKMIRNASKCSTNNCSLNYFYLGYPLGHVNSGSSGANKTPPSTPSITNVVSGDGEATIYFELSTGSEPIYYTVTSNPGGITVTGTSSPLIITGLTNGTPYTFTITASNSGGTSPSSNPSNPVTPQGVPTAPLNPTAIAGDGQATVSFTAPLSDGGSAILTYRITSTPDGIVATGIGTTVIITGLTNGTSYTFTVIATNSVGDSPSSTLSNAVTPATVPGAPTINLVSSGNGQLTVNFTAPLSNGGSVITDYKYSTDGSTYVSAGTIASPFVITGLTNGVTYPVTIKAVNSVGDGSVSNSVSGTPATVPGAPTITSVTPGNTQLTVNFTAPLSNGGSAITDYKYSTDGSTYVSAGTTVTPFVITGLTNSVTYPVTIKAVNSIGDGSVSNSVSGTPSPVTLITTTFVPSSNTSDLNTTWTAPPTITGSVTYLIVGGGGAGGGAYDTGAAGGGGGGEVETGTFTATASNTYSLTVGGGGLAPTPAYSGSTKEYNGDPGNDSSISGSDITTLTAVGGSGGNRSRAGGNGAGGTSFTSPSTASTGGNGGGNTGVGNSGGGGGGSSGNGGSGTGSNTGGVGGAGTSNSLSGSSVTYGTGGAGARRNLFTNTYNGTAGSIGTGNGGGGAVSNSSSNRYGGDGGAGIIILQYYA